MKKIILLLILFIATTKIDSSSPLHYFSTSELNVKHQLDYLMDQYDYEQEMIQKHKEWFKSIEQYLYAIAKQESSNDWKKYNKFGYIGKYQFGYLARLETGYDIKTKEWIENPNIWNESQQDTAMIRYLKFNKKQLYKIIRDLNHSHVIISNKRITESGVLAAAHLSGSYNVKKYFKTKGKYNPKDKLGTRLSDYLVKFSGFKFNL